MGPRALRAGRHLPPGPILDVVLGDATRHGDHQAATDRPRAVGRRHALVAPYAGNPVLRPGPPGTWNDHGVLAADVLVERDGSLLMAAYGQSDEDVVKNRSSGSIGLWRFAAMRLARVRFAVWCRR